jgi:hypothetical protein
MDSEQRLTELLKENFKELSEILSKLSDTIDNGFKNVMEKL